MSRKKITNCPNFAWILLEKLSKYPLFCYNFPKNYPNCISFVRKMPGFYIMIARKTFSRFFGGTCPPCPPSPTPMVLWYFIILHACVNTRPICIMIHFLGYSILLCVGPYVIICNNFTVTFNTCLFEFVSWYLFCVGVQSLCIVKHRLR